MRRFLEKYGDTVDTVIFVVTAEDEVGGLYYFFKVYLFIYVNLSYLVRLKLDNHNVAISS